MGADFDRKLAKQPGFQDVTSDLQIATPQVNVEIDRDKAAALGVTPQQIENALYDAFGERQSSTIYADVAEYWVVFEVEPQFQLDPGALARLYITSSFTDTNGMAKLVPLNAVADLTRSIGPTSISHAGQLPAVTISYNLAPGVSLGTAVEQVRKVEADLHMPATITGSFQGSAAVFQSSQQGLFDAAHRFHPHHLHHSWNPLRKLHPSADDFVRTALGGFRRADDVDDFQRRTEHLRLRRPHHARRHREEKRHHDD